MADSVKIKPEDWTTTGFDKFQNRGIANGPVEQAGFIPGAQFDALLDQLLFDRIVRFRNLDRTPQGNDPGKTYWDEANKKLKIWIDKTGKWAEIAYTTTSTSSTSTSTTT